MARPDDDIVDVVVPGLTLIMLKALDERYPEKSADKREPHEDLMWSGGQRDVVRFLHEQYRRENTPA